MSTKIPMFIGYDPENDQLFNSDGNIVAKSTLYPDAVIGEKKLVNFKLSIRQDDDSLVDYKEIPAGTTFEALVDNDYSNPTFTSFDNAVSDWTNTTGSEYAYQTAIATEPEAIYENNIIMVRGTAGALSSSEWDYVGTTVTVRLSDDTAPSSKAEDYLQYISGTYTPLFLFTANTGFNLTNTWYDQDTETYRDPVPTNGELTFEINANTEDFSTRLANEAQVLTTNLQIQLFETGTGEFSKMFSVNFVCRNRYLQNPLSLEVTGVNVYSKAEIDALLNAKIDKDLSGYTSKGSLDGTETIYIDDNGTPKATPSSSLLNVPSNEITGSGTVNMRTDAQFPTNYTDGLIYTIGTGVTAITDGTITINVNEQSTAIVINTDVAKASIDLSTDINQIAKQNLTPSINTVQFNPSLSPPSHSEGLLYYDSVNKAMAFFNDESDVIQQIGQEIWIRVYNDTGGLIDNGEVCYLSGIFSGFPTVDKALASDATKCLATIGVATHSIEDGTYGYITRIGTVRDLNTSGCTSGDILYLSASTAGAYTNVKPSTPNYIINVGNCGTVDASAGTIEVNITIGNNYNDIVYFYNGATLESSSASITSDGATVTLSLEKTGGGDLILFFDGNPESYDSTPAQTVSLTAGTDTIPTRNWVYIPESTRILTVSTSGFPTSGQFVPVADIIVPSASTVQTYGVYKAHSWTDHLYDTTDMGHLHDLNKWIRKQHATYESGVLPSFSGTGTATIEMSSTEGVILQLHDHTFPAFVSPAPFYVYNDSVTPYDRITNIASIVADSTGTSLLSSTYALVIWGVISEDTSDCKFFINLPSGSYGASKPDDTRNDVNGYTNYSIPSEFKGTGFLVHRLVISANPGGTAFTIYTDQSDDLRGLIPNTGAGSTVGGGAGTGDMLASIYDPAGIGEQLVGLTAPQTLTNKTLTAPVISTISNTGTITLPTSTDTLVGRDTTDILANKTLTLPKINDTSLDNQYIFAVNELTANRTITLPLLTGNDEFVFKDFTQTLTNKTLTSPAINTGISGTAVLDDDTFATASDTTIATSESIKAYVDNNGGSFTAYSTVNRVTTSAELVAGNDAINILDSSGGAITPTLAASPADGQLYNIVVIDATSTIELSGNGNNILDDSGNLTRLTQYAGFTIFWDNTASSYYVNTEITGTTGGGGASSPLTTKGDIWTYSTVDARLPVGTNGQILSADSAETTGLKWIDASSGGGLINIIANMTAETFSYPKTGVTNPFSNATNSPNIQFDVDNYGSEAALVSTSSNEPMQIPVTCVIPTGVSNFIFKITYEPETGNSWGSESIVWKGESKNVTDNTAWSSVTAFTIGTDTAPSSGSNPLVFESSEISLATMGLAVGDTFQMVIYVDSTSTWAHDIAFESLQIEVS